MCWSEPPRLGRSSANVLLLARGVDVERELQAHAQQQSVESERVFWVPLHKPVSPATRIRWGCVTRGAQVALVKNAAGPERGDWAVVENAPAACAAVVATLASLAAERSEVRAGRIRIAAAG